MAYVINEDCIACDVCFDECLVLAITEGDIYTIDPDLCIECGACEEVCPIEAIYFEGLKIVDTPPDKIIPKQPSPQNIHTSEIKPQK